jgi:ATP-dependent Clp protease ATP-binding subunit ClpA
MNNTQPTSIFSGQGVLLETVRRTVTATLPAAAETVPDLIPFDPQATKALELTFREALRMGHNYIGTEHILLALLELENGLGVLTGLGVDKGGAEANIRAALAAIPAGRTDAPNAKIRCTTGRSVKPRHPIGERHSQDHRAVAFLG